MMKQLKSISISKQFYSILKKQILGGAFDGTGGMLPSIRKLAQQYDISKTTVSSIVSVLENEGLVEVIQGKGIFVKAQGYNEKLIGVMLYNFEKESKVEAGILKGIQKNIPPGYVISMMDTANDIDTICRNSEYYIKSGAAGLIILMPKCPEPDRQEALELKKIVEGKVPVVFLMRDVDCVDSDFFTVDFTKGIYNAVDTLIKQGRKRIALISHDYQVFAKQETIAYKKAFQDNNAIYNPKFIKNWESLEDAKQFLESVVDDIDSLISSDLYLLEFKEIISRRKDQGSDLFLVGINSDLFTKFYDYPSMTINFPSELIGKNTVLKLIERIEGFSGEERTETAFAVE
jgi:DNA-binding LacI/PurR family transcriptional regulator